MGERITNVDVREEPTTSLAEYARVSIAFEVRRTLVLETRGVLGGFRLTEREIDPPYRKDYDGLDGASPVHLAKRWDLTNWGVLAARIEDRRVGGAILAFDTPDVLMLEGRRDLAVVWDLRVAPDERGRGVGAALWRASESWAFARGCRHLKVETQNVNVPACRFYARQGCVLGGIQRFAYPALPEEVQLLWHKALGPSSRAGEVTRPLGGEAHGPGP